MVLLSPAAHAQIKMGVGGPITGAGRGLRRAIEERRRTGGGRHQRLRRHSRPEITIEVGDDAGDAKQGRSVANQFVGDGVTFVVGHFNSSVTMPASDAYNEAGVLQITPGSTNPQITERGLPMLFRTCGRDDQQGAVAGGLSHRARQGQEDRDRPRQVDLWQRPRRRDAQGAAAAGVHDVLYEGLNKGEKDFSAIVSKIKSVTPTSSFLAACIPRAGCWCARCATRA